MQRSGGSPGCMAGLKCIISAEQRLSLLSWLLIRTYRGLWEETLTRYSITQKSVEDPGNPQAHIDSFRNAFLDHGLYDVDFARYEYTWSRWHNGRVVVEERLDRFYATMEWSLLFSEANVTHMTWIALIIFLSSFDAV